MGEDLVHVGPDLHGRLPGRCGILRADHTAHVDVRIEVAPDSL